jgi:hypothetical protein
LNVKDISNIHIPKIGGMIRSMEGFSFASALDLNMSYCQIKLDADAYNQKLCTIVFQWYMGKYNYKRLPMGIKIAGFLIFSKRHV